MSDVLRWEEPPPIRTQYKPRTSKYQALADSLRARPKEWALVLEDAPWSLATGVAGRVRRGGRPFAPKGAFEARSVGSGPCSVYARYVGEATS